MQALYVLIYIVLFSCADMTDSESLEQLTESRECFVFALIFVFFVVARRKKNQCKWCSLSLK